MIDPSIDEGKVFSFFAKPNMQLGLPNQKFATQITPEGRIYTGAAEYVFFVNGKLLNKRIWTLYKGYLPMIIYTLEKDGIFFTFKIFQFWLDHKNESNPTNFVKIEIKNQTKNKKNSSIAIGIKFHGKDHRPILNLNGGMQQTRFKFWKYSFFDEYPVRGTKIMYILNKKPSKKWETTKKIYSKPFRTIRKNKIVLISQFMVELEPKQNETFEIYIPHYPIDLNDEKIKNKLSSMEFDKIKREFEEYWENILERGIKISLPEKKVIDTSKTNLIFNFMTQDYNNGLIVQKVNRFQYNHFWLRDSSFYIKMYNMFNYPDIAAGIVHSMLKYQEPSGNFISQGGQLDGFGQSLWAFSEQIRFTRDEKLAKKLYPAIIKAIEWFKNTIEKDKLGLMPDTMAFDNESIIGKYTGHNIWALIGLGSVRHLMDFLCADEKVGEIKSLYKKFYQNLIKQLSKVITEDFTIPPGLNVKGGINWGNLLLIYPYKVFKPESKAVKNTFKNYYENKMAEGLATWMDYLHHYLTERIAQSFLILGDQKKVLECFYSMLVHTGSCNEGFEMGIYPWGDRDYKMNYILNFYNFPPHGWFGVAYNTLLRNMLIREEENNLHLFSAIAPQWIKGAIEVKNAPTYFGVINLAVKNIEDGIILNFNSQFHKPPESIIFHIPYFVELKKARLNEEEIRAENDKIPINPCEKFNLTIKWKIVAGEDLNYLALVDNYKKEYKKRFQDQN